MPPVRPEPLDQQLGELLLSPIDAGDLARCGLEDAVLAAQPVHFLGERLAEHVERPRLEEPFPDGAQHAGLDLLPTDRAGVLADPLRGRIHLICCAALGTG